MHSKSFLISLLFIFIGISTFSQTYIGPKFDLNGHPFEDYYDFFSYSPDHSLSIIHYSNSFEKGYYYDSTGHQVHGLIKFGNNKVAFKKSEKEEEIKLKPGEINHLVVGVDSFFTITDFYVNDFHKIKPEFVQFLAEIDGIVFIKHYFLTPNGSASRESYHAKEKEGDWNNISYRLNKKRFKEIAFRYFGHLPYLKEKIESDVISRENILSLIKTADYYFYFDRLTQC